MSGARNDCLDGCRKCLLPSFIFDVAAPLLLAADVGARRRAIIVPLAVHACCCSIEEQLPATVLFTQGGIRQAFSATVFYLSAVQSDTTTRKTMAARQNHQINKDQMLDSCESALGIGSPSIGTI